MNRRKFISVLLGGASIIAVSSSLKFANAFAVEVVNKITKTNEEWRKILTPAQYDILREEGTESPFSSPLNDEHREGIFSCAGCDLPLFLSSTKFDSGTGWPSFYAPIEGHIETKTDYKLLLPRTEYHCARCGGHHGHVFEDGPKPTGLRHCNNGAVLKFTRKIA